MDFDLFSSIVDRAYSDSVYSKQDCLDVFALYFDAYRRYRRAEHPPLKLEQVAAIIRKMPYLDDYNEQDCEPWDAPESIESWEYEPLIELYFRTQFRRCDYNINHFFSGRIRELKYYEWERLMGE